MQPEMPRPGRTPVNTPITAPRQRRQQVPRSDADRETLHRRSNVGTDHLPTVKGIEFPITRKKPDRTR